MEIQMVSNDNDLMKVLYSEDFASIKTLLENGADVFLCKFRAFIHNNYFCNKFVYFSNFTDGHRDYLHAILHKSLIML